MTTIAVAYAEPASFDPKMPLRLIAAKPLIQWTVETLQASKAFNTVIIAGQGREIEKVAASLGVSFVEGAGDYEAVMKAVASKHSQEQVALCSCLYPFMKAEEIKKSCGTKRLIHEGPFSSALTGLKISDEYTYRVGEIFLKDSLFKNVSKPRYFETTGKGHAEADVPQILKIDGVLHSDFEHENLSHSNIEKIIASKDNSASWCHRLVNTENNSATLISQLPGEGNRRHYHHDWNEWWYIVEGDWMWEIEGKESKVSKGDFVFIEKNKVHRIRAIGDKPAIRLAVSRADVDHVYVDM